MSASSPTPTPNIFHDSFVQFLISEVTVMAIAIATIAASVWGVVWLYTKQRSRKEISYELISNAPIANIVSAVKERVEVLLDGKPAKDVRLLVFDVWNSGNIEVRRDDLDEQISFQFEGTKVLAPNILDTKPVDLFTTQERNTFLIHTHDTVRLAKFMLNKKELIRFAVLLKNPPKGKIKVRARINGGEIVQFDINKQPVILNIRYLLISVGIFIVIILTQIFKVDIFLNNLSKQIMPDYLSSTLQVIGYIFFFLLMLLIAIKASPDNYTPLSRGLKNGIRLIW